MVSDPLHNIGVPPTPGTPAYGPGKPTIGEGGEQQRPFALPQETPTQERVGAPAEARPSPLDLAGSTPQAQRMTPEQLSTQLGRLQEQFQQIHAQLQDPTTTSQLTPDHYQALQKVAEKMTPDLRTIANQTGGSVQAPEGGTLANIVNWMNSSQQMMGNATSYLSSLEGKQTDIASMFKMQYGVQRASQRGELFASIMSSTVSGIKTIMSTQIG